MHVFQDFRTNATVSAFAGDKDAAASSDKKVHCAGINSCKGKGACKSATSSCKGMNECKGKGWNEMSSADCTKKGGTVVTDAK